MKHRSLIILSMILLMSGRIVSAQPSIVNIDVDARTVEQVITPWLYGACIEDVNHEIYGGILVRVSRPGRGADNFDGYEIGRSGNDGRTVVLHMVNITGETVDTRLKIEGLGDISKAKAVTLSGELDGRNTPENPELIVPVEKKLESTAAQQLSLAPYSYTVFTVSE